MLKAFVFSVLFGMAFAISPKIHPNLLQILKLQKATNIFISFEGGNTPATRAFSTQPFVNREQRISSLVDLLQAYAQNSQNDVLAYLDSQGVKYQSFWISNQIYISSANLTLVEDVANFTQVFLVERNPIVTICPILHNTSSHLSPKGDRIYDWGVEKIRAIEAWKITDGKGVVVANIDSGVRHTHEVLRNNYRNEYGWFDAVDGYSTPQDDHGHGTHCMGSMAGSIDIGVAPGATWMACKACYKFGSDARCDGQALAACGQWILCPFKADGSGSDCSKAPHVVSNSWGSSSGNNNFYKPVIDAWRAAGIIPVFSIGNDGPNCGTTRSPGDMPEVIAVGSTGFYDEISEFSSVGPTANGTVKPDIGAPGYMIDSAGIASDFAFTIMSGTSMAAPHVAGTIALILSVNPDLGFDEVRDILLKNTERKVSPKGMACGGISDSELPNNHFGYGRVDALKAVQVAGSSTIQQNLFLLQLLVLFYGFKWLSEGF